MKKETLINHDGGKWEGNHFANNWQFVITFEHGTCLHIISINWVFSWSPWWSTFMSHVTPLSLSKECIVHRHTVCLSGLVMLPSLLSCCSMFKGKLKKFYLCSQNNLCISTFESDLWLLYSHHSRTLFQVLCGWCVPLFGFMSSKRVRNTRYSSFEDKSKLICFTNLREEGFVPKRGSLNV